MVLILLFSVLVGGTDHIFYMRSRYSVSNIDIDMHLYALFACIQEQCHRVNVGGIFPFVYLATPAERRWVSLQSAEAPKITCNLQEREIQTMHMAAITCHT